jgi:hypothetical protein
VHSITLSLTIASVAVNLTGILLALFTCRARPGEMAGARRAALALHWAAVGLLCAMLSEYLLRCVVVGAHRFLLVPIHALDGAILVSLLAVELTVNDRAADEAVGLLIVVRTLRLVRLLTGVNALATERHAAEKARAEALAARVAALAAALCVCGAEEGRDGRGAGEDTADGGATLNCRHHKRDRAVTA